MKLNEAEESLLSLLPEGEAKDAFARAGLPSRRTEEWRWSDLKNIFKGPIAISSAYKGEVEPSTLPLEEPIVLTFANGRLVEEPRFLPDTMRLSKEATNTKTMAIPAAELAANFANYQHKLAISGVVDRPILVRFLSDGSGMHHTRLCVRLEKGASATIVEEIEGGADEFFANTLSEFHIEENAALTRVLIQEQASEAVVVSTSLVGLAANAQLHQTQIGFGGKLARLETQLEHAAGNSSAMMNTAYLLDEQNHFDATSVVHHSAAEAETEQLCKGVLKGRSKGVFQGKFYVAREGQQTDAQMNHNALLLSDTAEVYAKPELKIYADDVQCAHGNTSGSLDDNALFYIRQRGLTEHEARAMLVEAFLGEVTEGIEDEGVRAFVSALIASKMGASS